MSAQDTRSGLIKVEIRRAGVRPILFLGGQRKQVLILLCLSAYAAYILTIRFGIWYGIPAAGGLWLVGISILRKLAKSDPQMWDVLKRARKYRGFYPARGRFDAPYSKVKDFK